MGLGPRFGVAWSPSFVKNVVVRTGFGLYCDRGEFFTELSTQRGPGHQRPIRRHHRRTFHSSVSHKLHRHAVLAAAIRSEQRRLLPHRAISRVWPRWFTIQSDLSGCAEPVTPTCTPTGRSPFAFLFGGYDPKNTLPYSENWTLDLQWQPAQRLLFDIAYVGNHGVHEATADSIQSAGHCHTDKVRSTEQMLLLRVYRRRRRWRNGALQSEQVQTTIVDGFRDMGIPHSEFRSSGTTQLGFQ